MNQRRHIAIVGGLATLLGTTAFYSVFDTFDWFPYVAAVIAAVVAAMIGARALRLSTWAQPLVGLGVLLIFLTVVFGQGHGLLGVIPTPGALSSLRAQIGVGFTDITELAAPAPVRRGLLLLTVIGVGAVAILVDLLAVGMRRAALAGLPLLALYAVPVSIDREGLSWIPFALGAIGFLWLLVAEHVEQVQRWGRPFRGSAGRLPGADTVGVSGPLGATGRRLALVGIAIAVFIPIAARWLGAEGSLGIFGAGDIGPGAGRTVETINPITELRGQLRQGEEVEQLRVKTNDSDPFYLRLTTLDRFTGVGWAQRGLTAKPSDRVSEHDPKSDPIRKGVETKRQHTTIEVRGLRRSPFLPIYSTPRKIKIDGDWRWDRNSQSIFSTRSKTGGRTYTFDSTRVVYTQQELADAPTVPKDDPIYTRNTGLNGGADDHVEEIVGDLTRDKKTVFDKVLAINDYFAPANGFQYSLETQPGSSSNLLVAFLKNKRGYCEQYASAMAYMVRAAGIPARVAIGFANGVERNGYRSITTRDAHAWVEVYFSGLGWVPFDPTPAGGTGRTQSLPWAQPVQAEDPTGAGNQDSAQNQRPGSQNSTGPNASASIKNPDAGVSTSDSSGGNGNGGLPALAWWGIGLLVVLVLAVVPGAARWRLRRRRLSLAGGRDPVVAAHAAWDEVQDTLADVGSPPEDSETPRAVSQRLSSGDFGENERSAVLLLGRAEEQARYAPHASPSPGLAEALTVVRQALIGGRDRKTRLRATFAPSSVLTRAALHSRNWSESVSSDLLNARTSFVRRVTPRRRRPDD